MRILHTSDWHLGRRFGSVSLDDDQRAFVDWLLGQVVDQRIDLVVIAGDIYDRPVAPVESVVLFRNALKALQALGVRAAVITGNHDGPDRVAAYDDLLDGSGVFLRGGYTQIGEVITLQFDDGPLDLVLLPFLDPQMAPDIDGDEQDESGKHSGSERSTDAAEAAYERLMRHTHQSVLHDAITAALPNLTPGRRSLAVSHAYVAGASTSDSERKLTVGGTGTVEASLFEPFSYTALGHLHRPQRVAGSDTVRYSGTPLAYSFSEDHPKSITIVDMAADGSCTVEEVRVPVGRGVLTVTGKIDDLLRAEPKAKDRNALVRAVITDRGVVLDAKQRLSSVYPYVVEILLEPEGVAEGMVVAAVDGPRLSAIEATVAFWDDSVGSKPSQVEHDLLSTAIAKAEGVSA
jgi:exonuclease SbcD